MAKLLNYVFSGFFKHESVEKSVFQNGNNSNMMKKESENTIGELISEKSSLENNSSFVDVEKNFHQSNDIIFLDQKKKDNILKVLSSENKLCINNSIDLVNFRKYISMYGFEIIICMKSALFKNDDTELEGQIILTNYRITFLLKNNEFLISEEFFSIPILSIVKLDRIKFLGRNIIEIISKQNQNHKFVILDEELEIYNKLSKMIQPKDPKDYFTISKTYKKSLGKNLSIEGWKIYNALEEYQRQNINLFDQNSKFRKYVLNKNFEICETYPEILVLPQSFSDESVQESKNFRTKNRLPVFCWINNENKVGIWRSSQTKSGITQHRSTSDEKLLEKIRESSEGLIIFDARPYLNALANRIRGAGFENTDNYEKTTIKFCEIDNIHTVRNSLIKLHSLCRDSKM